MDDNSLAHLLARGGGPGGAESPRLPMGPGAPQLRRVLVRELADYVTYHGRRAEFDGVTGSISGLVATTAVGLTNDGQGVPRPGPTKLVLIDDSGQAHHFEFGAHDFVTLLD
ncbi:MAG: hypothetical protein CK429_32940 [Mycobacterium sp.]|nr:MAG: hypothetical protein CK429_32940 [Mycobacterium sp.]